MAALAQSQVVELLGGRAVLGRLSKSEDLVQAVRQGLPYAALEALTRILGLDIGEIGSVVGIPERTLARRKHQRALSPTESDRLYRIAFITQLASTTLGSVQAARAWMARENRSLGGVTPMSLLDTDIGSRQVEGALLRLSHGIYA
jgi:putative toxin-antitoxin system antitoxin component (TIGR02293 family)